MRVCMIKELEAHPAVCVALLLSTRWIKIPRVFFTQTSAELTERVVVPPVYTMKTYAEMTEDGVAPPVYTTKPCAEIAERISGKMLHYKNQAAFPETWWKACGGWRNCRVGFVVVAVARRRRRCRRRGRRRCRRRAGAAEGRSCRSHAEDMHICQRTCVRARHAYLSAYVCMPVLRLSQCVRAGHVYNIGSKLFFSA